MTDLALQASGLQLVLDLEEAGAITPVSLDLTAEMPFDRYEALTYFLGRVKRSCSWWIGDLVVFGEASYGQEVAQAADATGLAPETISHYANVCQRIPKSRRRPTLSFGVHALVKDRPPAQQKRWLDKAEKHGWDTRTLKHALDEADSKERGEQQEIEGTAAPSTRKVDKALVVEVAYAILRDARDADDGFAMIPIETLTRLRAALGEE